MKIYFATGNPGKGASLDRALAPFGFDVEVVNPELDEVQSDSQRHIATKKAEAAFAKLQAPVIAQDAAFHIDVLNGWPGFTNRYAIEHLGIEGYLRLMQPWKNKGQRRCKFVWTYAFQPAERAPIFEIEIPGRLTLEPRGELRPDALSPVELVFIPKGLRCTLAELSSEEILELWMQPPYVTTLHEIGRWLQGWWRDHGVRDHVAALSKRDAKAVDAFVRSSRR
jgi:XTP/dITP diphosphohydrolase